MKSEKLSQNSNNHIHAGWYIQCFGGPWELRMGKPTFKMDPESFSWMLSWEALPNQILNVAT